MKHLQDRVVSRCTCIRYRGRNLAVQVTYHSRISQIESVPAEALWEAVRLLSYVIFIRLNAAMWRHSLSYKQTNDRLRINCATSHESQENVLYRWRFTLLKRKKLMSDQGISTKTKLLKSTIAQMINTKFRNRLSVPELITATCGLLHGFSWTLSHWEKLNGLLDLL